MEYFTMSHPKETRLFVTCWDLMLHFCVISVLSSRYTMYRIHTATIKIGRVEWENCLRFFLNYVCIPQAVCKLLKLSLWPIYFADPWPCLSATYGVSRWYTPIPPRKFEITVDACIITYKRKKSFVIRFYGGHANARLSADHFGNKNTIFMWDNWFYISTTIEHAGRQFSDSQFCLSRRYPLLACLSVRSRSHVEFHSPFTVLCVFVHVHGEMASNTTRTTRLRSTTT